MGSMGLSCQSLHVDVIDWPLKLSVSAVQMLELVASDSELGSAELEMGLELCGEGGGEGSWNDVFWPNVLLWGLPFKDIRCMSNWFKQISAVGVGPEMGLG